MTKKRAWYWLLLVPFVAELWPPLFNRVDPQWYGVPFFYWYQLVWVVLTSLLIWLVMTLSREREDV